MDVSRGRVGSLIFLFVGVYGLIFSTQMPLGRWNEPGPGIFPLFLSISLCFSGILWCCVGKDERKEGIPRERLIGQIMTPLRIVLTTAAYILALSRMGYLLASILYLFTLFLWISRFRWWVSLGLSIVIGAGSWYFFGRLLSAQLPQGLFP